MYSKCVPRPQRPPTHVVLVHFPDITACRCMYSVIRVTSTNAVWYYLNRQASTSYIHTYAYQILYRCIFFTSFTHTYFAACGQAVATGVVPFSPRFFPSIFVAHRVQQSHFSSIYRRAVLTHALALSASQFVHKKSHHEFIRV